MSWFISATGSCFVTTPTPANNTVVSHFSGTVNVTFECSVLDENGNRTPTAWNLRNFRGEELPQNVLLVLPDTILEGDPTNGNIFFDTFRTRLTFPVFLEDFHLATLACGATDTDPRSALFPLRVYGKQDTNHSSVGRQHSNHILN